MATDIYMPQLGLTMTEGSVVRWLKAEGDVVKKGEPVLVIETDKVSAEVEAPADGVLGPILAEEGAKVPIGGILTHVLAPNEVITQSRQVSAVSAALVTASEATWSVQAPSRSSERRIFASPRARRTASRLEIDLAQVQASGPSGRIVEADVRWYADQVQNIESALRVTPVAQRVAEELGVDLMKVKGTGPGGRIIAEDVKRVTGSTPPATFSISSGFETREAEPLKGIRRLTAERMTHSFTTTPHFYLSVEVEATALTRMREILLARVEAATGARLTVTDVLINVCAQALRDVPNANVAWADGGGLLRHTDVNVGVAVAVDEGLVVPIIHHADQLTLGEIARRRTDLVARARSGKLTLQDLEGGTFTLSNLGMFGVDQFLAIINSPQSAILAVGRIKDRPIAVDGSAVVRPTMLLTLSADHRLLDGAQAARFLERVARLIEEPYLLLG